MLPILALNMPRSVLAAARGKFHPPIAPMMLSRTVIRELPDTARIVVKRMWEIRFIPTATGFGVGGQQIAVDVAAPPALEFLAQLEEGRQETGLFPMALSPNGMIRSGGASDGFWAADELTDTAMVDRAIAEVAERIGQFEIAAGATSAARQFLSALQASGAELASRVPLDLFRPQQSEWQDERIVELPQGLTGTISVSFEARLNVAGELMQRAERRVISAIGESRRTSSEIWELDYA